VLTAGVGDGGGVFVGFVMNRNDCCDGNRVGLHSNHEIDGAAEGRTHIKSIAGDGPAGRRDRAWVGARGSPRCLSSCFSGPTDSPDPMLIRRPHRMDTTPPTRPPAAACPQHPDAGKAARAALTAAKVANREADRHADQARRSEATKRKREEDDLTRALNMRGG
jgi:hypothetical protein